MTIHRLTGIVVLLLLPLLFTGCGTPRMVNRPQVNDVNKVAVVSVAATRGIHPVEGESKVGQMSAVASMASDEGDESGPFGGHTLVNEAVGIFTAELDKVEGWTSVLPSEFTDSEAYDDFVQDIESGESSAPGLVRSLGTANFIHAEGMPLVMYTSKEQRARAGELAQALGVDAVAVTYLDVAYEASTSIGGTGTAAAAVGADLVLINSDGKVAATTRNYRDADARFREPSEETTGMAAGEITYNEEVEDMFLSSIQKTAAEVRRHLNTDLKKTTQ